MTSEWYELACLLTRVRSGTLDLDIHIAKVDTDDSDNDININGGGNDAISED